MVFQTVHHVKPKLLGLPASLSILFKMAKTTNSLVAVSEGKVLNRNIISCFPIRSKTGPTIRGTLIIGQLQIARDVLDSKLALWTDTRSGFEFNSECGWLPQEFWLALLSLNWIAPLSSVEGHHYMSIFWGHKWLREAVPCNCLLPRRLFLSPQSILDK